MSYGYISSVPVTIGITEAPIGTLSVWGYGKVTGNIVNLDATASIQIGFESSHDDVTYAPMTCDHPDIVAPATSESFRFDSNGHRFIRCVAMATEASTNAVFSMVRGSPWR